MGSTTQHRDGAATVQEFADALGVSRWTVQRMISAGTIHSTKIGRLRRIPWAEQARVLAGDAAPTRRA
jgi:excisionase family DNA binding protein